MREILFRGKRIDNGEWIEGNYQHFYLESGELIICISNWGKETAGVIPETVGQYTGLKDMNGKKIFEGDIVKIYNCLGGCEGIGNVQWSELFLAWHTGKCNSMYGNYIASYEIIGNIHDNPELLEVVECRNSVKKTISMR